MHIEVRRDSYFFSLNLQYMFYSSNIVIRVVFIYAITFHKNPSFTIFMVAKCKLMMKNRRK